jgi:excisionase family DNA binding protein
MTAAGRGRPTRAADATAVARLLTIHEAAQHAGVSLWTVRGWITAGQLPAVRVHGQRRIRPEDLTATQAAAHVGRVVPAWRRNPQRVGRRLRRLREAAGLSQLALAATSGVEHETISRLELGHQAASPTTVRQLAQALGIEPGVFVARTKLPPGGLTTAAVATRLEVPRGRVQAWLAAGKLAGVKVSGIWRVPLAAVVELERHERLRGRSRRLDPRYQG